MARGIRSDLVDAVVLEVYGMVRDQSWLADRALEQVLRREKRLYASERRAASEAVYGLIRWQGQIDWLLGGSADHATRYAGWLARFGGLERRAAERRLGLNAGALRGVEEANARLAGVKDPIESLARNASLPEWIARRFVDELGQEEAAKLAESLNHRAPLTVRVNLLKGSREELVGLLAKESVRAAPTKFSPWGLSLEGHANAFALKAFQDGWFEIQDEGSQLIAFLCQSRPGQRVVDACAGAGGKTLALAMEMRNKGRIEAIDVSEHRLDEARRRARRAGVHNVSTRVVTSEGELSAETKPGEADLVLIDAPCSGLGTLRRKPDARWRLTPDAPERFATMQRALLARFAPLVKPGGRLVYATCSMGRTENDEVVADFLRESTGFTRVPMAKLFGAALGDSLAATAPPGLDVETMHLFPHRHGTDGFFAAAMERAK